MSEHLNARLVRRGFDSFAQGDLESLREWMTDEVVWHEPGRSPLGGDYKGPAGVLELLAQLRERSDGSFAIEIVEVLASAERAVVIQEETARRGDRVLDMASVIEFEIHHGKISEVTVYHEDTYHFDEFWS
jgi:ketosteroid isomerase-like protein